MPISLYDAIVPSQRQMIAAVTALVDKAAAHCRDRGEPEAALIEARLAPDMLPFGYQVKSVAEHSRGSIEGVRVGVYSPSLDPWPDSMAGLSAKLSDADAQAMEARESALLRGLGFADPYLVPNRRSPASPSPGTM